MSEKGDQWDMFYLKAIWESGVCTLLSYRGAAECERWGPRIGWRRERPVETVVAVWPLWR